MSLASVVSERRQRLGISRAQLAKQSGVSKMAISKIERGMQREITFHNAEKLAGALGMHPIVFVIETGLLKP